ncbi:MAG TPA: DUF3224 domain-containing protein [Nevskia sp.]|jgi:hypothetical protein|nr:DUF3224 domain-containing protein [Nevskia sp.]
MPILATGTVETEFTPLSADQADGSILTRVAVAKRFSGSLEAAGTGEMLSAVTGAGSSAFVAIERVSGSLHGRAGSFVLQHCGSIGREGTQYSVRVVPDTGTGQLAGLSGSMRVHHVDGRQSYEFEYCLPGAG